MRGNLFKLFIEHNRVIRQTYTYWGNICIALFLTYLFARIKKMCYILCRNNLHSKVGEGDKKKTRLTMA